MWLIYDIYFYFSNVWTYLGLVLVSHYGTVKLLSRWQCQAQQWYACKSIYSSLFSVTLSAKCVTQSHSTNGKKNNHLIPSIVRQELNKIIKLQSMKWRIHLLKAVDLWRLENVKGRKHLSEQITIITKSIHEILKHTLQKKKSKKKNTLRNSRCHV